MLRRTRRRATAAVVALLASLAGSLLLATIAVLAGAGAGEDLPLASLVVPLAGAHLALVAAATGVAAWGARRAVRTVETLFAHQDRVMVTVAHEIRSPLSRAVAILDEGAGGLLPADEAIKESRASVDELADLIDDLLQTARIMSGATTVPQEEVRVDELVRRSVPAADPGGPWVRIDARPVLMTGSPHLVRRAVLNLVRNAAVHAYAGGPGEIRVRVDDHGITVEDDGPGVPAARLQEIRYETPLSARPPSGSGVGLLLAGWVAETHGGRLVLRNRDEGGFEARLDLPVRLDRQPHPSEEGG